MRLVRRTVPEALAPFVQSLRLYEGVHAHALERVLPALGLQLLVNLDEDELRAYRGDGWRDVRRTGGAAVVGLRDGPCAIDTREQRRIAGALFRPGGAWPFLGGEPAHALHDREVDLRDLWGPAARSLREAMLEARTDDAALAHLEAALLARLPPSGADPRTAHAVNTLCRGARVDETARDLGTSVATLRRRFQARVGTGPKRFARVARLHRVLGALHSAKVRSWAALAVEEGFVDQSHLIRELRALGGITPAAYAPRSEGEALHVVID